jgi:hypothetical protein
VLAHKLTNEAYVITAPSWLKVVVVTKQSTVASW